MMAVGKHDYPQEPGNLCLGGPARRIRPYSETPEHHAICGVAAHSAVGKHHRLAADRTSATKNRGHAQGPRTAALCGTDAAPAVRDTAHGRYIGYLARPYPPRCGRDHRAYPTGWTGAEDADGLSLCCCRHRGRRFSEPAGFPIAG